MPRVVASLAGQLGLGVVDRFTGEGTPALPGVIFILKNTLAAAM